MRTTSKTFGGRIRAAFISGGASLLLLGTALSGTALADQPTTSSTTPTQAHDSETIGAHTHQLHGLVKGTPSAGSTTFTLTTERFGNVVVSFAGNALRGHGHIHGRARSFEVASAVDLKDGERAVVQGHTSADGKSFVARRVHVLPGKDAADKATHLVGTISAVATGSSATTFTVKLADGTTQSVSVSSATKIRPEGKAVADLTVGTKVTVVSKNGTATGVVVLPA